MGVVAFTIIPMIKLIITSPHLVIQTEKEREGKEVEGRGRRGKGGQREYIFSWVALVPRVCYNFDFVS